MYKKVAQISILFNESDILCCSETWLSSTINDSLIAINGKTVYRCDRKTRGGGVCIFVNNSLSPFCKIDDKSSYISPDLEIITIDFQKPGSKFSKFSCIYRPPNGNVKKCIDKLTEILSRRENLKKEIWLLGDFNVDYLKRDDQKQKKFVNFFKLLGLSQLISKITRPSTSGGSCLDWIVTNCRFIMESYVSTIYISDHYPVECIRKKAREKNTTVLRNVRDYRNNDKNVLVNFVKNRLSQTTFETEIDPTVKWQILYDIVYDILSVMCPYKKYRQRESLSLWITPVIYRDI